MVIPSRLANDMVASSMAALCHRPAPPTRATEGVACGRMEQQQDTKPERRVTPQDIWRVALALLGVVAVVQELRKPPEQRTWHGKVADVVPYDFRMPTIDRFTDTYWNPDGPVVSSKFWGVGWSPNFGAIKQLLQGLLER